VFFSLPPLFEAGLYITNRRVLVLASAFRLITQEMSQWYAGKSDTADDEFITRFEVGRSSLLRPYLDVVSTCGKKRWYRSPELRLRLHMQDAEAAYRVIAEQNTPDQGCSS